MSGVVLTETERSRLIALCNVAAEKFSYGDWQTLGVHTGQMALIANHSRLLRSLSFNDADYPGHAHEVMYQLVAIDHKNLEVLSKYISERYGSDSENISTSVGRGRAIVFNPSVFEVPDEPIQRDLIAVMSPFAAGFEPVFEVIQSAANSVGFQTLRAKDIWQHSTVIQDVFSLIFRAHIVVCDFTNKNPNVFYEAGIAHTLGKHVVPITQSSADIPFDIQHHRYLTYLNNAEGRDKLRADLSTRFRALF